MSSPSVRAPWKTYYALLDELRDSAVWRHEEDGLPTGTRREQRPPRFVAVVEPEHWDSLVSRVAELEVVQQRTKWPIRLYPEVWGWGKVTVSSAVSSRRISTDHWVEVGLSKSATFEDAEAIEAELRAVGHQTRVTQREATASQPGGLMLEVNAREGLSVRSGHGRAFVLRAWDTEGYMLHKRISVGAIVVQGVEQGIHMNDAPRKQRWDAAYLVGCWGQAELYQRDGKEAG